jgi:hypothetical protein
MIKRLVLVICLVGFLAGCERPLKVTLDGKNPPTFRFDGSGDLQRIAICEITPEGKLPPYGSGFWVLFPRGNVNASKSPPVTYGVIPDGFYQTLPSSGSPPPLQEGKIYAFGAETREAPGGDVWFTIRNGKSVTVVKTDPADPNMR